MKGESKEAFLWYGRTPYLFSPNKLDSPGRPCLLSAKKLKEEPVGSLKMGPVFRSPSQAQIE
ncbi:hypothetical protein HispidOSU_027120, partial [Sigmodon hispidus]